MQHHSRSPTPTVLENPILNWSLILYLKALINWVSHVLYYPLNFLQQAGVLSPSPSLSIQEAQECSLTCTRATPVKQRSCPPLWCKQFNLPAEFFQACILQLSLGNTHYCCYHPTPLQAITLGSANIFPWPLLGFTHSFKTSLQYCKPASLAPDLYLSLAEFNLESIPGPTPTLLSQSGRVMIPNWFQDNWPLSPSWNHQQEKGL